jgi:outer membrane protein
MKKGALIFNVVLSVAVLILFYLYFSKPSDKKPKPKGNETTITTPSDAKILYINSDSVNANYKFFSDLQVKFENDNRVREEKLRSKQGSLQKMLKDYEANVMTMTTRERQKEEEKIGAYQQQLQQDMQEFQMMAGQQEADMINQIYDTLYVFFDEYAKEKNVDMIFTFQKGGQIMYINENLDVTNDVIQKLNERHAKHAPKEETVTPEENK